MSNASYNAEHAARVAREFNDYAGAEFLRVEPNPQVPVIPAAALGRLEQHVGWYHARPVFELLCGRAPSHAELIAVGRLLGKRYARRRVGGNMSLYFIAPAGTPVPSLA